MFRSKSLHSAGFPPDVDAAAGIYSGKDTRASLNSDTGVGGGGDGDLAHTRFISEVPDGETGTKTQKKTHQR